MYLKCIIAHRTPDIEKGGDIDWAEGKVYEVSKSFGEWLVGCYDRNFEMASKPAPKAKSKAKAKGK